MGQRLNIEIVLHGEVLANAYYHWSGYTDSAFHLALMIIKNDEPISSPDDVVQAVRMLEVTGAHLTSEEIVQIQQRVTTTEEFKEATNRNTGLIAVSKSGMDNTRNSEEARVTIDLDCSFVYMQVYYTYDAASYIRDYEEDEDEVKYNDLPVIDFDLEEIPFEKFEEVAKKVEALLEASEYTVKTQDGEVYSFIA